MNNKLVTSAVKILEARSMQMVTEDEWEGLAQAVKEETGEYVQWRTYDELPEEEDTEVNP